jgi:hypothetical protein
MNETFRLLGQAIKDTSKSKYLGQTDTLEKIDHFLNTGEMQFPVKGKRKIPAHIGVRELAFDCGENGQTTVVFDALERMNNPIFRFVREAYFKARETKDYPPIKRGTSTYYRGEIHYSNYFTNVFTPEENLAEIQTEVCNLSNYNHS